MLGERLHALRVGVQRQRAWKDGKRTHSIQGLDQTLVAAVADNLAVELPIEIEQGVRIGVPVLRQGLDLVLQRVELIKIGRIDLVSGEPNRQRFQLKPNLQNLGDFFPQVDHDTRSTRSSLDETLVEQAHQRFANGGTADAEPLRELHFGQRGAGRELPGKQQALQFLVYLITQLRCFA